MTRIDRYVLHRLLAAFGLSALVLVLVYWVNRAVMLFDQIISDGQSAWVFLEFTALSLPSIVRIVLPLAAFAAALWGVNRMGGDSELTVLRATGASPWQIARPVLAFGLAVGVMVAVLSHVLGPASQTRLKVRQAEIAGTATARLLRAGEFVSPLPGLTLYIREVSAEGEFRGVLLSDSREAEGGTVVTTTAARAYLVRSEAGPQLVMVDGQIERLDRISEDAPGRLAVTSFDSLAYDLAPLLPEARVGRRGTGEIGTLELLRTAPELLAETGQEAAQLRARAHLRIAEALLAPAAALIAVGCLLVGRFSRLGAWPQIALAVLLAIVVRLLEGQADAAVREAPALWPLAYAPAAGGMALASLLLWWAARPRACATERSGGRRAGGSREAPA